MVESVIKNITGYNDDTLNDLAQNIYIDLMSKADDKILEMYKNKQIKFFIVKMVKNQIYSTSSNYYFTYRKYKFDNIDDYADRL